MTAIGLFTADIDFRMAVINGLTTKVQGRCNLPPGYFLITVPGEATFDNDQAWAPWRIPFRKKPEKMPADSIAVSNSIPQALAAVIQGFFAAITLYRSYGHQIDHFGFAAFGLTVVPYAVMSLLNLVANVVCPTYPAMYLVSNKTLRQLQADSSNNALEVDSVVGTLSDVSDENIRDTLSSAIVQWPDSMGGVDLGQLEFRTEHGFFEFWSFFGIICVNLAIIGGLSKFRSQSSSISERIWTMLWLAFGVLVGLVTAHEVDNWESRRVLNMGEKESYQKDCWRIVKDVFSLCLLGAGAIGGFVVVGKEILSYGVCNIV